MRTVEVNVYSFEELSSKAKAIAIENYRNRMSHDHVWDEAHDSVVAFHEVFKTDGGRNSWLEFTTSNIEDDVLELSGLRLHKYIINNYWNNLFKGKYLKSTVSDDWKPFHPMRRTKKLEKGPHEGKHRNTYRSTMFFENDCVLTGVCYDYDLLRPIYEFLEKPRESASLNDLFRICFDCLDQAINDEIQERESDEYISEEIMNNDYEFTDDGEIF